MNAKLEIRKLVATVEDIYKEAGAAAPEPSLMAILRF